MDEHGSRSREVPEVFPSSPTRGDVNVTNIPTQPPPPPQPPQPTWTWSCQPNYSGIPAPHHVSEHNRSLVLKSVVDIFDC
jgi:hypothetical protein